MINFWVLVDWALTFFSYLYFHLGLEPCGGSANFPILIIVQFNKHVLKGFVVDDEHTSSCIFSILEYK